jgi:hypothetical protein
MRLTTQPTRIRPQPTHARRSDALASASNQPLAEWVVLACLAYVLWKPVSSGMILYPALATMAIACLVISVRERPVVPAGVIGAWLMLVGISAVSSLVGSLSDTPGLQQQATHWFGSLFIWGAFAVAMTPRLLHRAICTITLVTAIHAVFLLVLIGQTTYGLPALLPDAVVATQGAAAVATDGVVGVRWFGLSTLTAAAPLLMAMAIIGPDGIVPSRRFTIPVASLATVAALTAGRRGILVVVVLAPLITLAIKSLASSDSKRRDVPAWQVLGALAMPALLIVTWANPTVQRARTVVVDSLLLFTRSLDSASASADDAPRLVQASRLLGEWESSPLVGQGLGAVVPNYTRSELRPWSFELQYHQLLFNSGLVGVLALAAAMILAFASFRRGLTQHPEHRSVLVATAVGAIALVAANTTNPYLQAVGHGWGIALAAGALVAMRTAAPASTPMKSRRRD